MTTPNPGNAGKPSAGGGAGDASSDGIVLWIDDRNRIVEVNEAWNRFALANGGDTCVARLVVGRNLRDFIRGDATLMLLDMLMLQARSWKKQIERVYRCDSSEVKRHMEMRIALDGKRLRFTHRLVHSEPMRAPVQFLYDQSGPSPRKIIRCSMCNRVQVQRGWMEPDSACASGQIHPQQLVIYSVCPTCKGAVRRPRQAA